MKKAKRKVNWGSNLAGACADMGQKLIKRGDLKSARSWLNAATKLLGPRTR